MRWSGDVSFLNCGTAVCQSKNERSFEVTWSFARFKSPFMPFYFYSCSLEANGFSTVGTAVGDSSAVTAKKSFAEAWERFWMFKFSSSTIRNEYIISSNGFAAGETDSQARLRSKNELIERAIFLKAWQSMQGWQKIKFKLLKNKALAFSLQLRGWNPYLFQICSNAGTLLACLLVNAKVGAVFDISLYDNSYDAESKLLYSVIRSTFSVRAGDEDSEFPIYGKPSDHAKFYSNCKNLSAFDFLVGCSRPKSIFSNNSSNLVKIDLEYLNSIETISVFSAGQFPAVARSYNKKWEPFLWGKASIAGANLWPHPLA